MVPEEARLMTVDEDVFFFMSDVSNRCVKNNFNNQDFELIIFGTVSAVCIAIYPSS